MHYTLQLPTDCVELPDEFQTAEALAEMARAAEAAGFGACAVTEHPIPEDRWLARGGHHALDPFVALSFAAAATRRLRLQTHLLVLPYRNPFLTAKAIASLDQLSGGRVTVGVGVGYLEPEFRALGADFAHRNERTDEGIRVMREVWRGESVRLEGPGFAALGHTALPRPLQRPAPPLWVGGNSRRAIRRAVELGDGWMPFPVSPKLARHIGTAPLAGDEDLARRLAEVREHAERAGRTTPFDVCYSPVGMGEPLPPAQELVDRVGALAAIGVTWLLVGLPHRSRAELLDAIARFGETVIAH